METFWKYTSGVCLKSADAQLHHEQVADIFVNDNNIPVTSRHGGKPDELELVSKDQESASQSWERLLFGLGGELALEKGFWWLLAFSWVAGKASPLKLEDSRESTALTSGRSRRREFIKRLDLSESHEMLGVFMNPLGTMKAKFDKRRGQSKALAER